MFSDCENTINVASLSRQWWLVRLAQICMKTKFRTVCNIFYKLLLLNMSKFLMKNCQTQVSDKVNFRRQHLSCLCCHI